MRKGSFVLGSLGRVPQGIKKLMLPLCAAVIPAVLLPAAGWAASQRECSRFPTWWQRAASSAPALTRVAAATPAPAPAPAAIPVPLSAVAPAPVVRPAARPGSRAATKEEIARVIQTRATWYGPGFHGHRTASGERFDQYAMTLASRHLPFGTRVRVVNTRNGRAAIARVNDRGPFRSGYTADLSKGLAYRIGMLGSGPVRLEILKKK